MKKYFAVIVSLIIFIGCSSDIHDSADSLFEFVKLKVQKREIDEELLKAFHPDRLDENFLYGYKLLSSKSSKKSLQEKYNGNVVERKLVSQEEKKNSTGPNHGTPYELEDIYEIVIYVGGKKGNRSVKFYKVDGKWYLWGF